MKTHTVAIGGTRLRCTLHPRTCSKIPAHTKLMFEKNSKLKKSKTIRFRCYLEIFEYKQEVFDRKASIEYKGFYLGKQLFFFCRHYVLSLALIKLA